MGFNLIETGHGRHDRVTKDGRKLWYDLRVIQQPERARACGSGPKSSADRRPVDPPPVVELHVYEGEDWNHKKDITFNYNANFFIFTTLEHARVMAHGRLQTPASNTPPVLSGMPVSGMAYLDRPQEAGYFLFPDLSVRHEGRYRLVFNLYEQTKEDKDGDAVPSPEDEEHPCGNFAHRMKVHSNDFSVFSAKKFPGLTESTTLSRTVAEQGCRVRIRRDVRMRRRDGKPGGDYENAEEDFARRRRTQTPESVRARSMSNHSVERTPYSADSQRRPSGVDYPPPGPGMPPQSGSGYLQFGSQPTPQYPQFPSQQPAHSSGSVPPSPSYPNGSYPQVSSYPPPPPPPQPFGFPERPPSQPYRPAVQDNSGPEFRRPSEHDLRRQSVDMPHAPPAAAPAVERSRPTLPPLGSMINAETTSQSARKSVSEPQKLPGSRNEGSRSAMSIEALLVTAVASIQPEAPLPLALPQSQAEGGRGLKRQRDDSDPFRLMNGARQPEDAKMGQDGLMPFRRANGDYNYAKSMEER